MTKKKKKNQEMEWETSGEMSFRRRSSARKDWMDAGCDERRLVIKSSRAKGET